jgi:hemerythrin
MSEAANVVNLRPGNQIEVIVWNDLYSVGHPLMDQHHQAVIGFINELAGYCFNNSGSMVRSKALDILQEINHLAQLHFKSEELLLSRVKYPFLDEQCDSHERYSAKISYYYQSKLDNRKLLDLTRLLLDWWNNHILVEDMKYKEYMK